MKLKNIFSHRNNVLLKELVITDFKLRYEGSILGYLWTLLRPLLLFSVLYTIFGLVLRAGSSIEHYSVYLLLGIVLWSFFTEATNNGLNSIVNRGDLIRKINFPKYIIVISGTISALINLLFSMIVVIAFMLFNNVDIHAGILLFPLIVLELYIFALALAFFLSTAYVKFRDIGPLWEVGLQTAFYATPILYLLSDVQKFSNTAATVMMLSPAAQIIQDARYLLITQKTITLSALTDNILLQLVPFAIVIIIAVLAAMYFRKTSHTFAENV